MTWKWATGTPRERAEMVRMHARRSSISYPDLRRLFKLNKLGLHRILAGQNWQPRYSDEQSEKGADK